MFRSLSGVCLVLLIAGGAGASPLQAQGLIWRLPDDGAWIRYEGTVKNKQLRPESSEGDLELEWQRALTIKSIGQETAKFQGVDTPCRWIEITSVVGRPSEAGLDPGPVGKRIYKVLVPEKRIIGQIADSQGIPETLIPIVKGFRKIGERDAEPVEQKMLSVDPMLVMIAYYPDLKPDETEPEALDLPLGALTAQKYTGTEILETETNRTTQEGALWVSKEAPFGLAKFQVKTVLLTKDLTAPKDEFTPTAELVVEMSAVESGTDARSELPEQE